MPPRLLLVALLFVASGSVWAQQTRAAMAQFSSAAAGRAEHLRHGINASEWFAQSRDYSVERLSSYTTLDDIVRMKRMGFDHVRLSIDPAIFDCPESQAAGMTKTAPGWGGCPTVQVLDQVIAKALEQDLTVILDLHPSGAYKKQIATSDNKVEQLILLWGRISAYYAKLDAARVFFEVMNEPEMADAFRWGGIEERVVGEIRRNAPQHTILVSGANYSDIEDLVRLPQFADPNLIYVFHYYEPHVFTHQGASWGEPFWNTLRQVPFPGSDPALGESLAKQSDEYARFKLTQYGLNQWNEQHVAAEIQFAADWAKGRGVPLICDEFGVYRYFVKPADRERWLATVRGALEKNKVGWTMWDYQGGFGVVSKDTGTTVEDDGVLKALGLR